MHLSAIANSPVFNGITPVRVYNNGKEVTNENTIRKVSSKIIKIFCGPLDEKYKPAAAQLAVRDADYAYEIALKGYVDPFIREGKVPSDYIKAIYDKNNRGYLVTGFHLTSTLNAIGHRIGIAKKECNSNGIKSSHNLENAKNEYWNYVKTIGNDLRFRTREAYDRYSGKKIGLEQEIRVDITTKPQKVKGKVVEQINIDNIYFRNI